MRVSRILVLGLVAGSLILAQGVLAKGQQNIQLPSFESFDLNKDGKISEDELIKVRTDRMAKKAEQGKKLKNAGKAPLFSEIDANQDGFLSQDEFTKYQAEHSMKRNSNQGKKRGNKQGKGGGGKNRQ